jgi:hypothetical protein
MSYLGLPYAHIAEQTLARSSVAASPYQLSQIILTPEPQELLGIAGGYWTSLA